MAPWSLVLRIVAALFLIQNASAAPPGAHGNRPPGAGAVARPRGKNDDLSRARALDKEGAKAYAAGRYTEAIHHFEESYRLGGPPFELWNVAKCYIRLDQTAPAAEMLERYLAVPNLPKQDREEASKQLDALK